MLDTVGGQRHAPAALPLGNRPGTHCTTDWVGPMAGLEWCGKSLPPVFHHRAVQVLASGYFDYAIPARLMGTAATKMVIYHASKS